MTMELHPHCSTCVNLHCREPNRPGASCEVTSCLLACGASFHGCKAPEHRLLCPLEPVPCPSRCYGCPRSMPRAWVAQHLSTCPASVVQCKHTHIPCMQPVDDNAVIVTLGTPDKHSTDTHTASIHSTDAHTSDTNAPFYKKSKSIPSEENGIPCVAVANGVSTDLEQSIGEGASTRQPVTSAATKTDNHLDQSDRAESMEGGSEAHHQPASESGDSWAVGCAATQPLSDFDTFPPCYEREARLQLLQRSLPPALSVRLADTPANHGSDQPTSDQPTCDQPVEGCSTAQRPGTVEPVTIPMATENLVITRHGMLSAPVPLAFAFIGPYDDEEMLLEDAESRPQCSQLFRRDEFLWHSRNVHADLDLLEHACPLATYGCPVSQRQLATRHGGNLVYDTCPGAFGLLPKAPEVAPDPQGLDRLSRLPLELQRHLLGYLDGYSLSQLALTSSRMREVCASLLRTRGMVVLRWARCCPVVDSNDDDDDDDDSDSHDHTWKVQDKVWRFSTAFSQVETWDLVDAPSLSNHLQCCPWNEVERPLEARALPCMSGTPEVELIKPSGSPSGRTTRTLVHSFAIESLYWECT